MVFVGKRLVMLTKKKKKCDQDRLLYMGGQTYLVAKVIVSTS